MLLAAKYKNIYALEDNLGVHPIRDEWQTITGKRRTMKWFSLERAMPLLFILAYAMFFAVQVGGVDVPTLIDEVWDGAMDLLGELGLFR